MDTGVFIDYLAPFEQQNSVLRPAARRGRDASRLASDAMELFEKCKLSHFGATSCLTFYEGEEAMYGVLKPSYKGVPKADKLLIPAARAYTYQIQRAIVKFGFEVRELTMATVAMQLQQSELETEGIRAADALHFATAIGFDADVFVTTDKVVLDLDQRLFNLSGKPIRCADTDGALRML